MRRVAIGLRPACSLLPAMIMAGAASGCKSLDLPDGVSAKDRCFRLRGAALASSFNRSHATDLASTVSGFVRESVSDASVTSGNTYAINSRADIAVASISANLTIASLPDMRLTAATIEGAGADEVVKAG